MEMNNFSTGFMAGVVTVIALGIVAITIEEKKKEAKEKEEKENNHLETENPKPIVLNNEIDKKNATEHDQIGFKPPNE